MDIDITKFQDLFPILMLCVSMAMWVYWLADIFESRHPLPIRDRRPKTWHPLIVMLTLLLVGFMVSTSVMPLAKRVAKSTKITESETIKETEKVSESENKFDSENDLQTKKKQDIKANLKLNILMHLFLLLIMGIPFYMVSQDRLDAFGFRKSAIGTQITDGCVGFVASLAPVSLTLFMIQSIKSLDDTHPLLKIVAFGMEWSDFSLLFCSAVITAPLWEEFLFRVLLQGFLQDRMKPGFAILLTSLAFASVHNWPDMIGIFSLSLVLGYVFYRTNSYLSVFLMHAMFNLFNLFGRVLSI